MLATILPSCKTNPKFTNNKSITAFWHKNTVYHDKNENENNNRFVLKDSSPKKNPTNIPSKSFWFLNAIDNYLNTKAYSLRHIPNMDDQQTMFRAFALLTGSINIFSADLVTDTHNFKAYVDDNYLSSEL